MRPSAQSLFSKHSVTSFECWRGDCKKKVRSRFKIIAAPVFWRLNCTYYREEEEEIKGKGFV